MDVIINPYDLYAIETGLKIKKQLNSDNVHITALTMGPKNAEEVLRKAIALGCDDGILLNDKKFSGSDTLATAIIISQTIKEKVKNFDLIICGQIATDGDTAQTPIEIATLLGIPKIGYVTKVLSINSSEITCRKENEDYLETQKMNLPGLISVQINKDALTKPKIDSYIKAQDSEIKVYGQKDINVSPEEIGYLGSKTYVVNVFKPEKLKQCEFLNGDNCNILAEMILKKINEK